MIPCCSYTTKSDWTETHIKLDKNGNEYFRQVVRYTPNSDGFLLYKDIVTWTIDARTEPCIQKIVYAQYDDIQRIYHKEHLYPSPENGYVTAQITKGNFESVTVAQIAGTNHIFIDFVAPNLNTVNMEIKDLYGITVLDKSPIDVNAPYVDLGELPTGVYSLHLDIPNTQPCKFIFKP